MAAYIVVDTKIHDQDEYDEYKALARPIAEAHGGKYLARGGDMEVIDEELWSPTRIVLLEFSDMETARNFVTGEDYAPVAALRHRWADSTLVIVEGA